MNSPDVIVIGAGVVGAACALELIESGLRVLVIDRGAIASGTTGAGEGNILVSDKEIGPELILALRSRQKWFEISEEIGGGFELEAKGGIVVTKTAEGATQLASLADRQEKAGVKVAKLDSLALRKAEPHLSPHFDIGFHYLQDSQCQPMLAAAIMLQKFRALGGAVLSHTEVTAIESDSNGVKALVTKNETFPCRIVVNAAGTWAGEIAALAGGHLPISPRRGFILVTHAAPRLVRHKVYDADYVANVASGEEGLQTSAVIEGTESGTILIGASRERVGFDRTLNISILRTLAAQAIELFPVLAKLALLRAYHGFRPYAPDHLPVIGEDVEIKGLWHCAGHEGAGIGLAPASAEIIASQILKTSTFMDAMPFSPGRFAAVK